MIRVIDSSYLPFPSRHRPFIVLPDVYMILLGDLTLKDHHKFFDIAACLCNDLTVQVKTQLTFIEKMSCFLVFQVHLCEKGAFQQVRYLVSLFFLYFCSQPLDNKSVNFLIHSQYNCFFLTVDRVIRITIEGSWHQNFVLFVMNSIFMSFCSKYSCEDYS